MHGRSPSDIRLELKGSGFKKWLPLILGRTEVRLEILLLDESGKSVYTME